MPIVKERLKALIDAADAIQETYITCAAEVELSIVKLRATIDPDHPAWSWTDRILSTVMLPEKFIFEHTKVILEEKSWWKHTHKLNERQRRRHEQLRREDGVQPQQRTIERSESLREIVERDRQRKGLKVSDSELLEHQTFAERINYIIPPEHRVKVSRDPNDDIIWECQCNFWWRYRNEWIDHLRTNGTDISKGDIARGINPKDMPEFYEDEPEQLLDLDVDEQPSRH